jgi:hypothetical protein
MIQLSHLVKLYTDLLMLFINPKDAINSASAITQTLSREWADGQCNLLAIAAAGANSTAVNPLVTQLSNGPLVGLHEMVHAYKLPSESVTVSFYLFIFCVSQHLEVISV